MCQCCNVVKIVIFYNVYSLCVFEYDLYTFVSCWFTSIYRIKWYFKQILFLFPLKNEERIHFSASKSFKVEFIYKSCRDVFMDDGMA